MSIPQSSDAQKQKAAFNALLRESFNNLPKYSDEQLEDFETTQRLLRVNEMLRRTILENLQYALNDLEQSSDNGMRKIYSEKIKETLSQWEINKENKRALDQKMREKYSEYLRHMALCEDCSKKYNELINQNDSSD